jgi:protein tyrosine/serine phosphatase
LKSLLARLSTVGLVFGLSFASITAAERAADDAAAKPAAVDVSRLRIDNFGRVNANYFRGEQPDAVDYADLAGLGIRTVIDLQADGDNADEAQLVERAGMTFYRIPMTTRIAPTAEQQALFLQIVNDPARYPVYVHCAGGRHRTGVMTALYRMTHDGWTPDQAFKEMKQYKFGADFLHPEFKRFVYAYQVSPAAAPAAITAAR